MSLLPPNNHSSGQPPRNMSKLTLSRRLPLNLLLCNDGVIVNKIPISNLIAFLLPTDHQEGEIELGALKLAKAGWSVPSQLSPIHFQEVGHSNISEENLSGFMVNFYTRDNSVILNELIQEHLLTNQDLAQWHVTIEQCKQAYDAGLYNIVVTGLLPVIEGYLSKLIGTHSTQNVRVIKPTKNKASGSHPFRLDKTIWLSIDTLIEDLYEKSNFSEMAPAKANRHWILHGRHTPTEAKIVSLKFFNLLSSLTLAAA